MPDVLVYLLESFWRFWPGLTLFGLAGSYSAFGGTQSSQNTPGGFLDTVWHAIAQAPANVLRAFGANIGTAHKATRSAISHWALANSVATARFFTHLNILARETFRSHAATATTAADSLERMRHVVIPHAITTAVAPVRTQAREAHAVATTALAREHALSTTFTRTRAAQVRLNVHYTHAIDVAIPQSIGRIRAQEEALSRDQAKLRERTTSLENGAVRTFEWIRAHPLSAVTGVFAGAVAIALARLGFGFFRCRSWQKLGRSITCGMGSLLEDLLFGLIDVLVIADLCQITKLMIRVAESSVVQGALGTFITGIDDLLLCQGVDLPPALDGYWTGLPPAQAFSALPAV